MHCDVKKFEYKGDNESWIKSVDISASVYGTTMTLNFPSDKSMGIIDPLLKAGIPLKSIGAASVSINTPLHETTNIKKALEILSTRELMDKEFAQKIMTNYPNGGHGGKMDLNTPFKGINKLLMFAAANIYNLNEQIKRENEQKSHPAPVKPQEDDQTYCGFKKGFLIGKRF